MSGRLERPLGLTLFRLSFAFVVYSLVLLARLPFGNLLQTVSGFGFGERMRDERAARDGNPEPGTTWRDNPLGMEFVWVPPGTFRMGSSTGEDGREDDETAFIVSISQGFWLGKYEVTQAQWESVGMVNRSRFRDCGTDCPIDRVSWNEAQQFLKRLSKRDSRNTYRLPTEAEWEWAARAGADGPVEALEDLAWFSESSANRIHRVGLLPGNAWGLHDMLGNVYEWVRDWYGPYPSGRTADPAGPPSGAYKVLRGGSWYCPAGHARPAFRNMNSPFHGRVNYGLRCVREPKK